MKLAQALRAAPRAAGPALPPALQAALGALLAGLGLLCTWSTAGVAIVMLLLLAATLALAPAVWRAAAWREPTMAIGLALLAFIALHTLATSAAQPHAWSAVNRYHELVMAPLLLALFRLAPPSRRFLQGLACGALLYGAAHWLALGWPALAAALQPRRISAGYVLAVTAFLLWQEAGGCSRAVLARLASGFLAFTVLFAIEGRTGHLVLLALVAWAAWLHSPRRWRWALVLAVPLALLVLSLSSTAVRTRTHETLAGTRPGADGQLTPTGIRIELLHNALALARQHWATGAGYARYAQVHGEAARARDADDPQRLAGVRQHWAQAANPHNEYLMQLVSGGIVGLALFLAWLLAPLARGPTPGLPPGTLAGVVLAFALGCLFNSLLLDFTEGHFHAAVLAWLLARAPASAPLAQGGAA